MQENAEIGVGLARDPALLNRVAWTCRWQSRARSNEYAERVPVVLGDDQSANASVQRALAQSTLAFQAKWRGDFDQAMTHVLSAEQGLDETDFPETRAGLYAIMGVVHYSRHRLDLADGAVKRGLDLVKPEKHPNTCADLLTVSANIHRHGGDMRSAGEVLGRARQIATGAMLARVEHNVARWMQSDQAPAHALDHAETAISLALEHQNNVIMPYAHEIAGACLIDLDRMDAAEAHFKEALSFATRDNDARAQCQIIGWFGALESKRRAFRRAKDLYRFGQEIAGRMNYTLWQLNFARRLAEVYEELGELENAVECYRLAWKLADEKRQ